MEALILVGHGSLNPGAGAAMIRLAARLRERGAAPLTAAGFLNYSRPSFQEALEQVVARGATSILLQPYLLVPGAFARGLVPRLLSAAQAAFPRLGFTLAAPIGEQPALADLAAYRAEEAGAGPHSAVLLAAHGTPDPAANAPVQAAAARLREAARYAAVEPCYLGLNEPSIPAAIAALADAGHRHLVLVPYMLQLGGHVAEDLPAAAEAARATHPKLEISLAEHLGYHPLLAEAIAASARAARRA